MSEWIKTEDRKPLPYYDIVFVTDGITTMLATYIENPLEYYGSFELKDLGEEWIKTHWKFEGLGPFIGNQECFADFGDITHWMPLPKPPEKI